MNFFGFDIPRTTKLESTWGMAEERWERGQVQEVGSSQLLLGLRETKLFPFFTTYPRELKNKTWLKTPSSSTFILNAVLG